MRIHGVHETTIQANGGKVECCRSLSRFSPLPAPPFCAGALALRSLPLLPVPDVRPHGEPRRPAALSAADAARF